MRSLSASNKTAALFRLKSKRSRGVATMMVSYKVTLITPEGKEFECPGDVYILDHATEEECIDLPFPCTVGSCSSCARKIVNGKVDQFDGSFLDNDQTEEGFVLVGVAYLASDVTIETHKESNM